MQSNNIELEEKLNEAKINNDLKQDEINSKLKSATAYSEAYTVYSDQCAFAAYIPIIIRKLSLDKSQNYADIIAVLEKVKDRKFDDLTEIEIKRIVEIFDQHGKGHGIIFENYITKLKDAENELQAVIEIINKHLIAIEKKEKADSFEMYTASLQLKNSLNESKHIGMTRRQMKAMANLLTEARVLMEFPNDFSTQRRYSSELEKISGHYRHDDLFGAYFGIALSTFYLAVILAASIAVAILCPAIISIFVFSIFGFAGLSASIMQRNEIKAQQIAYSVPLAANPCAMFFDIAKDPSKRKVDHVQNQNTLNN